MKLTINGEAIELKSTMRAVVIYEQILGQPFNPKTITESILYLYAMILANCKDFQMTFEEFIDYLDEHKNVLEEFNEFLYSDNKKNSQFGDKEGSKKKRK